MLGLIWCLSDVWYLPQLWNVGRTKKWRPVLRLWFSVLWNAQEFVFYIWVIISLYHDVCPVCGVCAFTHLMFCLTMYEEWFVLCCLFDECDVPLAAHSFRFVYAKRWLWGCAAICFTVW